MTPGNMQSQTLNVPEPTLQDNLQKLKQENIHRKDLNCVCFSFFTLISLTQAADTDAVVSNFNHGTCAFMQLHLKAVGRPMLKLLLGCP